MVAAMAPAAVVFRERHVHSPALSFMRFLLTPSGSIPNAALELVLYNYNPGTVAPALLMDGHSSGAVTAVRD
jgi:hypothetical protein